MNTALLYSGGLDSACAFFVLGQPRCLYVGGEFGPARKANAGELRAIARHKDISPLFAGQLTVKEIDHRPFMRANEWNLPRDEIGCMAAWAEGFDAVMFAWTSEDASEEHAAKISEKLSRVTPWPLRVDFPLVKFSKRQLVEKALTAGAPLEFLRASFSCLTRGDIHCGRCANCVLRHGALEGAA